MMLRSQNKDRILAIKSESQQHKNGLLDIKSTWELKETIGQLRDKIENMFLKIDEKEIDDKRRKLKQFSVGGLKSE